MIGKSKLLETLELALGRSRAEQTEVSITGYDSYLTRFANSQIHQNVAEHNSLCTVRCAVGKKVGAASTNDLDPASILKTLQMAHEIARFQLANPDFASFPAGPYVYPDLVTYVPATHELTAETRAQNVRRIVELVQARQLRAFGSYTNGAVEVAVGNSLGVRAYGLASDVYCNVVAVGPSSSGYAAAAARNAATLDCEAVARRAAEKAELSADPTDLDPGTYEVILEPLAAAELAEFLGWLGFGAKALQEGRSFLVGKLGTRIVDEQLSFCDDALNESGFAFPFDAEGVPKQRVPLLEHGIARAVVYDSLTAGKEPNKTSTGHAVSGGYGPAPVNIVFAPGNSTPEGMIADCRQGILVTRFHYTNVIDPMRTVFTGMTRDGTFLIENGRISRPVKNLRFTQNILSALRTVYGISQELALTGGGAGYGGRFATGTLAPFLHLAEFSFSGKTEF